MLVVPQQQRRSEWRLLSTKTGVECNNFDDESHCGTLTIIIVIIIICQINNNQHQIGGPTFTTFVFWSGWLGEAEITTPSDCPQSILYTIPPPSTPQSPNITITHFKWLITYRNIACQRVYLVEFNGCTWLFLPATNHHILSIEMIILLLIVWHAGSGSSRTSSEPFPPSETKSLIAIYLRQSFIINRKQKMNYEKPFLAHSLWPAQSLKMGENAFLIRIYCH